MTLGLRLVWGCSDRRVGSPATPAITLFELTAGGGPALMVEDKHDQLVPNNEIFAGLKRQDAKRS